MSEPLNTSAPPVNTNPLALDAGQIASARETWVSLGFDPAAFDAAANPAPADPAASDTPASPDLSDLKPPALTEAQAEEITLALIARGVPREAVEEALKADGYELVQDTRTDEQIEFDRALGTAAPHEYRIDYMGRIPAGMDPAQLAQANTETTTWLAQVGFPPEIGPAVIERAMDVGQAYARASEPECELWKREQYAQFVRMAGSDERAEELKGFAADTLRRGDPAYALMLDKTGVLYDAGIIMHLALQGERLKARG